MCIFNYGAIPTFANKRQLRHFYLLHIHLVKTIRFVIQVVTIFWPIRRYPNCVLWRFRDAVDEILARISCTEDSTTAWSERRCRPISSLCALSACSRTMYESCGTYLMIAPRENLRIQVSQYTSDLLNPLWNGSVLILTCDNSAQ